MSLALPKKILAVDSSRGLQHPKFQAVSAFNLGYGPPYGDLRFSSGDKPRNPHRVYFLS